MLCAMVTTLGCFPCLVNGKGPPLVFLAGILLNADPDLRL